jgi:hypothetical protein
MLRHTCAHAARRQHVRLQVVDYHAVLVAADGERYIPGLTVDGVHPNAAGYTVVAPLVEAAILADQKKRALKDLPVDHDYGHTASLGSNGRASA